MKSKIVVKINGMDCASCVMNIDGILEDTKGVFESQTNFAKEQTAITYDSRKITSQKIIGLIKEAGYESSLVD